MGDVEGAELEVSSLRMLMGVRGGDPAFESVLPRMKHMLRTV